MTNTDEIEKFIIDAFERNFEFLQLESGHSLTADIKLTALNQVLLYWRKLQDIALSITETEVRLILPNQQSPSGRTFNIEGVVDIVRDAESTTMYDIKTHAVEDVRSNLEEYEKQLNIYAYIWSMLRCQPLDTVAIIATAYPTEVKNSLNDRDPYSIIRAIENWDPIVEIKPNAENIENIIAQFGKIVDLIETHKFHPPSPELLASPYGKTDKSFGYVICRNCDGRFSCSSYINYRSMLNMNGKEEVVDSLNDWMGQEDLDEWLTSEYDETMII